MEINKERDKRIEIKQPNRNELQWMPFSKVL